MPSSRRRKQAHFVEQGDFRLELLMCSQANAFTSLLDRDVSPHSFNSSRISSITKPRSRFGLFGYSAGERQLPEWQVVRPPSAAQPKKDELGGQEERSSAEVLTAMTSGRSKSLAHTVLAAT